MSSIKPDIEIARAAKIHPIKNVLAKLNVPDGPETFMPICDKLISRCKIF